MLDTAELCNQPDVLVHHHAIGLLIIKVVAEVDKVPLSFHRLVVRHSFVRHIHLVIE